MGPTPFRVSVCTLRTIQNVCLLEKLKNNYMSLKCNQLHPFYSKLKYFENSMTFDPSVWVKGQDKISVMFGFGNFYSYTINRN